MTDRIRLDDLTSDQLDALYDRIATLESVAAGNKRHVQLIVPELERAEAAIARVRAIHTHGPRTNTCNDCGQPWPCEVTRALDEPSGPAAAEGTELEKTARVLAGLHRSAEQNVSRVIALYERWVKAGPPPIGTSMSRWWDARLVELRAALGEPGPAAGGCSAPGQRTEPNNHGPA